MRQRLTMTRWQNCSDQDKSRILLRMKGITPWPAGKVGGALTPRTEGAMVGRRSNPRTGGRGGGKCLTHTKGVFTGIIPFFFVCLILSLTVRHVNPGLRCPPMDDA